MHAAANEIRGQYRQPKTRSLFGPAHTCGYALLAEPSAAAARAVLQEDEGSMRGFAQIAITVPRTVGTSRYLNGAAVNNAISQV